MLFSGKERIDTARRLMLEFLLNQVQEKDYCILPKLYEMAKIDNKKLLAKAHTSRNIFDTPSNTVFSDMVYLIYDEAENNTDILQIFYDLVRKIFSNKVIEYERLMEFYDSGDEKKWKEYLNNTYRVEKKKILLHSFCLYIPLFLNDMEIVEEMIQDYLESLFFINVAYLQTDQNLGDDEYVFNTEEKIFDSVQFERYISKRKVELAEYLSDLYKANVTEENLCRFIHDTLKSKAERQKTPQSDYVDGIVTGATANVIVEQNGGMSWYSAITNDGKKGYISFFNYHPDVEKIICLFFKEYIKLEWRKYKNKNDEGFSKIYMSRDCIPENIQETYTHIMYLYNMDVMCKLFNNVKDDYYLNFSWEKIAQQDMVARYNNIISEMEDNIKFLNARLEQEKQNKILLREQFLKKKSHNDEAIHFEQTLSKLNKKIEGKEQEIISQKHQLESKEEYIQLLLKQDDPDITRDIDVSLLQQKRYLFVGHANEALPELRRVFPNSIFMDSENMSINDIKVDGIVMLIKYMSHAMFYKVNASSIRKEVPVAMCNTKNINNVYNKMATLFEFNM